MTELSEIKQNNFTKEELLKDMKPLLDQLFHNVRQQMMHYKAEDLAHGQVFLLFLLSKSGTSNASDLAKQLGITSGAITGMTDKLVSMKLIKRERSEKDRRLVLVSITAKGQETVKKIQEWRYGRLIEIFLKMDEDKIRNMIDLFQIMVDLMEDEEK